MNYFQLMQKRKELFDQRNFKQTVLDDLSRDILKDISMISNRSNSLMVKKQSQQIEPTDNSFISNNGENIGKKIDQISVDTLFDNFDQIIKVTKFKHQNIKPQKIRQNLLSQFQEAHLSTMKKNKNQQITNEEQKTQSKKLINQTQRNKSSSNINNSYINVNSRSTLNNYKSNNHNQQLKDSKKKQNRSNQSLTDISNQIKDNFNQSDINSLIKQKLQKVSQILKNREQSLEIKNNNTSFIRHQSNYLNINKKQQSKSPINQIAKTNRSPINQIHKDTNIFNCPICRNQNSKCLNCIIQKKKPHYQFKPKKVMIKPAPFKDIMNYQKDKSQVLLDKNDKNVDIKIHQQKNREFINTLEQQKMNLQKKKIYFYNVMPK